MKKPTQKHKFIAAAHAAECDESEAAFEGKLRRIAKVKPKSIKKDKKYAG